MERNKMAIIVSLLFVISTIMGVWLVFSQQKAKKDELASLRISQNKIAIVNVYGTIRASSRATGSLKQSSDRIIKRLKKIEEDKSIKAVVLRINSPGGTVAASEEVYAEIQKVKAANKPVVASLSDIAASGGYYVAVAADKIVSDPGTLTGSIGVIMELGNYSALMKKFGVKIVTIKSGKHKDIGSFSRDMTPEEESILQSVINDAYERFLSVVITGRKMDPKKARILADGRIYTGAQAKNEGLVDMLGSLDDAIEEAKKLANIKGKVKIVTDTDQWEKILDIIPSSFDEKGIDKIIPDSKIRFEYSME